jgi:hypothetical protein
VPTPTDPVFGIEVVLTLGLVPVFDLSTDISGVDPKYTQDENIKFVANRIKIFINSFLNKNKNILVSASLAADNF